MASVINYALLNPFEERQRHKIEENTNYNKFFFIAGIIVAVGAVIGAVLGYNIGFCLHVPNPLLGIGYGMTGGAFLSTAGSASFLMRKYKTKQISWNNFVKIMNTFKKSINIPRTIGDIGLLICLVQILI